MADREYDAGGELVKDWRIGPDDDLFEVLRLSRERYAGPAATSRALAPRPRPTPAGPSRR